MMHSFGTLAAGTVFNPMVDKLVILRPEMALFVGTVIVMILGLSRSKVIRKSCAWISGLSLVVAGVLAYNTVVPEGTRGALPGLMPFVKTLIAAVGVLLVMVLAGTVDRDFELEIHRGRPFDAIRSNRSEFYAFFLFSLTGLMLCADADDLMWLFLALELTSLPTYVMVSISTARTRSQEAGVKYFFLGAMGAATFLYGFAMLYGVAGTTALFGTPTNPGIAEVLAAQQAAGGLTSLALLGLVLSILGVSFKIAAVPMHFYTPDVYEGAAPGVSAFLAFVPKAAGFITLMLLCSLVGWGAGGGSLPESIRVTLWVMAALTMTVGNVMAVLQSSVKRILAYSSVAHSGYMLVGLIAGPGVASAGNAAGAATDSSLASNGLAATLFYLLCYGFMNLGTFAVLACLERRRDPRTGGFEEVEAVDDLRGLWQTQPLLAVVMVLSSLSLLGFPILLGFWGKFYLFTSAISSGELLLVIIMGLNSAVGAFYYLRLVFAPFLASRDERQEQAELTPFVSRIIAGVLSAASVVALIYPAGKLMVACDKATQYRAPQPAATNTGAAASAQPAGK